MWLEMEVMRDGKTEFKRKSYGKQAPISLLSSSVRIMKTCDRQADTKNKRYRLGCIFQHGSENERVYGQNLLQQSLPRFFNNGPHYHKSKYEGRMGFFHNNGKVKPLSYSKNKSILVAIIQMSSHWQLAVVTPRSGRQVVKPCWLTGSSVLANYVNILSLKILGGPHPRIRGAIFGLRSGNCTPALWRGNEPGFEWHVLN